MRQSLYLIFGRNFPRKWSLQDRSAFGALSATLEDLAKRHGVPLEKKQPLDLLKALLSLWGRSSVYLTCYSCVYLMHGLHLSEDSLSLSTIDMMYVCSSLSFRTLQCPAAALPLPTDLPLPLCREALLRRQPEDKSDDESYSYSDD